MSGKSRQTGISDLGHSMSNPNAAADPGERPDFDSREEKAEWLVERFYAEYPERANRPVSADGASISPDLLEGDVDEVTSGDLFVKFVYDRLDEDGRFGEFRDNLDIDAEPFYVPLKSSWNMDAMKEHYAKLKGVERAVKGTFSNVYVVLLTFTQSWKNRYGEPRCPMDHEQEIREGMDEVRLYLNRVLKPQYDDRTYNISDKVDEFARVNVVEGQKNGFPHWHVALFIDVEEGESLDESDFDKVMRRYCDAVPGARWENHNPRGHACSDHGEPRGDCYECSTPVAVRPCEGPEGGDDDSIGNAAAYVSAYMGMGGEEDILDMPVSQLATYSLIAARRGQKITFSNSASDLVEIDQQNGGQEAWDEDEWDWTEEVDEEDDEGVEGDYEMTGVVECEGDPEEVDDEDMEHYPPPQDGPEPLEEWESSVDDPPRPFAPPPDEPG